MVFKWLSENGFQYFYHGDIDFWDINIKNNTYYVLNNCNYPMKF